MNQERPPTPRAFTSASPGSFTASLRVPVLPANRAYLRALRAAEMEAWERAMPGTTSLRYSQR